MLIFERTGTGVRLLTFYVEGFFMSRLIILFKFDMGSLCKYVCLFLMIIKHFCMKPDTTYMT